MKWLRFPAINDKLNSEWRTEKQRIMIRMNGVRKMHTNEFIEKDSIYSKHMGRAITQDI